MDEGEVSVESTPELESFRWIVRLSDKAPGRRYVIVAVALLAFGLGLLLTGRFVIGLLGFAMIMGSTAEYWLGARYAIDSTGISSRVGLSVTSLPWESVKRVVVEGDRILFSPLIDAGRTDVFRGVRVTLTPDLRDRVLATVHSRLSKDVRFLEY